MSTGNDRRIPLLEINTSLLTACPSECMQLAAPLMVVVGEQRAARGRV